MSNGERGRPTTFLSAQGVSPLPVQLCAALRQPGSIRAQRASARSAPSAGAAAASHAGDSPPSSQPTLQGLWFLGSRGAVRVRGARSGVECSAPLPRCARGACRRTGRQTHVAAAAPAARTHDAFRRAPVSCVPTPAQAATPQLTCVVWSALVNLGQLLTKGRLKLRYSHRMQPQHPCQAFVYMYAHWHCPPLITRGQL